VTEPRATYRLFVTDLDGTVLGADLALSERTREALGRLSARGVRVAIATGRMLASATPFFEQLALDVPMITYNGAWIRCLRTQRDLWHRPVPAGDTAELVGALEDAGLHVNMYLDDRVHVRVRSPEALAYLAHARVEPVWCDSWAALGPCAPTKILAVGPEPRIRAVLAELRPRFAGRAWLTQSMPTFLEVAHPEVNKGTALAHLAAHLGVPQHQIVAVGDGMNDLEMLQWAGLGVAMGDAQPAVKAGADRVTAGVAEDGVAALIDALIAEGRI
jgi:Cof subfamily protein (haloacid dehalogenase superfamily)